MEKSKIDAMKAIRFLIKSTIVLSVAILVALYYATTKGWIDMPVKYILLPSYILVIVMLGFFGLACEAAIHNEYKRLEKVEQKKEEDKNNG